MTYGSLQSSQFHCLLMRFLAERSRYMGLDAFCCWKQPVLKRSCHSG